MPRQSDLRYTFEPSCETPFDVVEFTLEEGLSQPFELKLELASANPAVVFEYLRLRLSHPQQSFEKDGPLKTLLLNRAADGRLRLEGSELRLQQLASPPV